MTILIRVRDLDLRSIQLLPGGEPRPNLSKRVKTSTRAGGVSRDPFGMSDVGSAKYIHCVEEARSDRDDGDAGGGVVIEWARRAVMESETRGCADVQEVLVKCRVGQFPSQKSFYLLVSRKERPCEGRHVVDIIRRLPEGSRLRVRHVEQLMGGGVDIEVAGQCVATKWKNASTCLWVEWKVPVRGGLL